MRRTALTQLWSGWRASKQLLHTSAAVAQQAQPAPDLMECFVNDQPVKVPKGSTVLAACDAAGIDIPRYDPHLPREACIALAELSWTVGLTGQ